MYKISVVTSPPFARKRAARNLVNCARKQLRPWVLKMRRNTSNCVHRVASNVEKRNDLSRNESLMSLSMNT
jgi:hypothetical protein